MVDFRAHVSVFVVLTDNAQYTVFPLVPCSLECGRLTRMRLGWLLKLSLSRVSSKWNSKTNQTELTTAKLLSNDFQHVSSLIAHAFEVGCV